MSLVLVIGLVFSPLAALAAFLIVFGEAEHHYPSKKEPLKHGLEAATFTFLVFMALAFFLGLFLNSIHF